MKNSRMISAVVSMGFGFVVIVERQSAVDGPTEGCTISGKTAHL